MKDIPEQDALPARIIDIRAKNTPNRTYAFLPKGQRLEDGFYPLSYSALAKAIDATARWMDDVLGGRVTGDEFPAIPYIGLNDLRYLLLIFASVKTHRNLMIPLLYNTPEAQVRLLKHANCNVVLASKEHVDSWAPARAAIENLRLIEVPELSEFIHDAPVDPYPYTKTVAEALSDPVWTIQTSGTTGNPQPLIYSNNTVMLGASLEHTKEHTLAMPHLIEKSQYTNMLPLSWGAGLVSLASWPIMRENVTTVLPSTMPQPMTPEYAIEATKWVPRGAKNGVLLVPDTLRLLARHPEHLKGLEFFDWVGYVGAPLDFPTGDLLAPHTRVQSFIGSTDSGTYPLLLNDPSDWKIHRFHPSCLGFHLQHFQEDLHELCISKLPNDPRACFLKDPTLTIYHTKDLWRKAPGREAEGFWMTAGRVDDFVKLSSMTKFNAIQIEQVLDRHPLIEKSLVAGDAKLHPFALVQVKGWDPASMSREEVLSQIWSACEDANKLTFKDAHLTRELTLIADPEMPLKRTAKGTVNRRNTIKMYEQKIEDAYARVEGGHNGHTD